jgi:hypothetical protein
VADKPEKPGSYAALIRQVRSGRIAGDEREGEQSSVSDHDPPETPTKAARTLIGWFAGALAFKCIETIDSGYWPSLGYGAGAVIVAIGDYKLPTLLAGSPALTKSLNKVAADARWWVAVAMVLLLVITFGPYMQEGHWPVIPFTGWGKAVEPSQPQTTAQTPLKPLLPPGSPFRLMTGEQIVKEIDDLQARVNKLTQQLSDAQQAKNSPAASSTSAPQPLPQSAFAQTYGLSQADVRNIRDEVFKIRDSLPPAITFQLADDPEARSVHRDLSRGIGLAGIDVGGASIGYPITPQETGISIRVLDLMKIPDGALKLAQAIKNATGVEPRYTASQKIGPGAFMVFVGTNPKDH